MFRRLFGASKTEIVAPIKHGEFGELKWDSESKHWCAGVSYDDRQIPVYIPGKPPTHVGERASEKLLQVIRGPKVTLDMATEYLAAQLSAQARRTVAQKELLLENVIVYAETEEGFHVCFQWQEQPDWVLRVFFKNGEPANWAFDD